MQGANVEMDSHQLPPQPGSPSRFIYNCDSRQPTPYNPTAGDKRDCEEYFSDFPTVSSMPASSFPPGPEFLNTANRYSSEAGYGYIPASPHVLRPPGLNGPGYDRVETCHEPYYPPLAHRASQSGSGELAGHQRQLPQLNPGPYSSYTQPPAQQTPMQWRQDSLVPQEFSGEPQTIVGSQWSTINPRYSQLPSLPQDDTSTSPLSSPSSDASSVTIIRGADDMAPGSPPDRYSEDDEGDEYQETTTTTARAPSASAASATSSSADMMIQEVQSICLAATKRYIRAYIANRKARASSPAARRSLATDIEARRNRNNLPTGAARTRHSRTQRYAPYVPHPSHRTKQTESSTPASSSYSANEYAAERMDVDLPSDTGSARGRLYESESETLVSFAAARKFKTSSSTTGVDDIVCTNSLLANVSTICSLLWRRAGHSRLDELGVEGRAARDMADLLAWGETVVFGGWSVDGDSSGDDDDDDDDDGDMTPRAAIMNSGLVRLRGSGHEGGVDDVRFDAEAELPMCWRVVRAGRLFCEFLGDWRGLEKMERFTHVLDSGDV